MVLHFFVKCFFCNLFWVFIRGEGVTVESAWLQGHGYFSTAPLARSRSDLCQPNISSHVSKCIHLYSYSSCNLHSNQSGNTTQQHRPKPARSKVDVK